MDEILIGKEEIIKRRDQLNDIRFPTISCFLFLMLIFKIFFNVYFSPLLLIFLSLMLITTIIYSLISNIMIASSISAIISLHFAYMIIDLINLTIIIYLLGGVVWIGFIFYAFYAYINFIILPRKYAFSLIGYCGFLYVLIAVIQYFSLFSYKEIFSLEERVPQNINFVITTVAAVTAFLWLIGYYGDVFYKILGEKIRELQKTKALLEDERASLEIRVGAKTRELREGRERLEDKIIERTKEVEKERKELAKKLSELEKFHKVAVGRELKMRDLKKEITKLKTDS